jgi:hypothetical protein
MKTHTTNYTNTFIEVAEDCPVRSAEIPPIKGDNKTIANLQYEMVFNNPYKHTSDDVLFHCHAVKNKLTEEELENARSLYFSKGQACFRASPLTKRYGYGVHYDSEGRMAIYPCECEEYVQFASDKTLTHLKAMRSRKG